MLWAVAKKNKPLNIEYNNTLQMIHWRNSYLHFEKKTRKHTYSEKLKSRSLDCLYHISSVMPTMLIRNVVFPLHKMIFFKFWVDKFHHEYSRMFYRQTDKYTRDYRRRWINKKAPTKREMKGKLSLSPTQRFSCLPPTAHCSLLIMRSTSQSLSEEPTVTSHSLPQMGLLIQRVVKSDKNSLRAQILISSIEKRVSLVSSKLVSRVVFLRQLWLIRLIFLAVCL